MSRTIASILAALALGAGSAGAAVEDDAHPFVAEVSAAFQELGMAPVRARCYGDVLLARLQTRHHDRVIRLLRDSRDKSDVRRQVTSGGLAMISGFMAANRSCPEDMG